jgi:hypothetical protein
VITSEGPSGGFRQMPHKVEVEFDEFGWQSLTDEAKRQGVTLEELVAHAAMYYLAEADPELLSHRVMRHGQGRRASLDDARRRG